MPLIETPPDPELVGRFRDALSALAIPPGTPLGIAVSGGPDSLALLLLAKAGHDGPVCAATVDHGLRVESATEARMVAALCAGIGVEHTVLPVTVALRGTGTQAAARDVRYEALAAWCAANAIPALATAHHADDQAETLLMRLNRGAGLSGLSGIRAARALAPGVRLVRPLLSWRKDTLAAVVAAARITAVDDPSNRDHHHDRTAVRALLAANPLLDPVRIAASAGHLADSEAALAWATETLLGGRVIVDEAVLWLDPVGLPVAIIRRAVADILGKFNVRPDGPALSTLIARLNAGSAATLGGVMATPGARWRFAPAPPRRATHHR